MRKRMCLVWALLFMGLTSCGEKKDVLETVDTNYRQEVAYLTFHEGELRGRLMHPNKGNRNHSTLVLIVPGAGRIDLNGNNDSEGETNNLLMISEFLADEGYYSLRYDKRGIGESSKLITTESDMDFHDAIDDVVKWVDGFKKDGRFQHIVLLGHDEGALIATQVSVMQDHIDGLISVSGWATPGDQVILEQLKSQSQELYELSLPLVEELKMGNMVPRVPFLLFSLFRPSVQPYLISWFDYIPLDVAERVKVPTLIVHGDQDLKVGQEEGVKLHQAIAASKLVIINDMNHVLKPAGMNQEDNLATYHQPQLPLHEKFKEVVLLYLIEIIKD